MKSLLILLLSAFVFSPGALQAQQTFQEGRSFRVTLFVNGKAVEANQPHLFFMISFKSEAMTDQVRIEQGSSGVPPTSEQYAHRNLQFTNVAWWRGYEQRGGQLELQEVRRAGPGNYQIFATGEFN
jgi:hypothetical protein